MQVSARLGVLMAASVLAVGCETKINAAGGGPSAGDRADAGGALPTQAIPGLRAISIEPAMQALTIDGASPATANYRATGQFDGNRTEDITSKVRFRLAEPALGSFSGARFTSGVDR